MAIWWAIWRSGVVGVVGVVLVGGSYAMADQPGLDELLQIEREADREASEPEEAELPAEGEAELDEAEADALPDGLDPEAELERMLSQEEAADALAEAVRQMGEVSRRLGERSDPGLETQREQEAILARLEQVIEAASEPMGGAGGSGGEPSEAREQDAGAGEVAERGERGRAGEAGTEGGEAGEAEGAGEHDGGFSPGDAIDPDEPEESLAELRREWGQLPPRLRDEISEGLGEAFSPVYRAVTEAYYQRLAEEQD